MARKYKEVFTDQGTDRRATGYYSTPIQVATYIYKRLTEINPLGIKVVDTCIGMEELSSPFLDYGFNVTGIDITDHVSNKRSTFIKDDFISIYELFKNPDLFNVRKLSFTDSDFWIANPPYNCHEVSYIQSNKAHLKKVFNDVGVHNMYSMFMSAMIDMAKTGAVIGLITLDSFLTSKAHKELREKILDNCIIHDILLCPTDIFLNQGADVRTCILIIQKGKLATQPLVKLLNRPSSKYEFYRKIDSLDIPEMPLSDILLNNQIDNHEFLIGVPGVIKQLFSCSRVGEKFKCITGISTGNDKKYLSKEITDQHSVPFYKNPGSKKFYCEPDGYLIDDFLEVNKVVKNFMVRNVPLLFKEGITCSSMGVEFSACYLPPNSTYGVNPNIICDEKDIWWLLSYLNSNIAKYIVRGVLIRTNMVTSGYISRLPIPDFKPHQKDTLTLLAKKAYELAQLNTIKTCVVINEINENIYEYLNIPPAVQIELNEFCKDIIKKT
ncbi:MAG: N-6 DNA methylase [Gammaproteobacteria bacterium]|nr:N-6 DNA methylase [Gammaproteobacteria bacterium]